ncbi:TVP38/TMEM64 family protein [Rhodopila sp.]|uniref:TVP38/TMEM64 family protein n=1 Tax=Rhodopila sp. TaxID=2480087 RepID=UPI003D0A5C6D
MRRFLPLLVLAVLAVAGFVLLRGFGWHSLARHQGQLLGWAGAHPVLSAALFVATYIATAALSLPQGALLTVAGGWLFGTLLGCGLTVIGATAGASILLVVVRSAFAETLNRHRGRIPPRLQTRLARDGFSYLLALRLVPLFPFWVVNLAAAVAGTRLRVFAPATLLGIVPASLVLSSIGAGVGGILAQGGTPDLSVLFSARILWPLLGLALLSLAPVLWRRRPGADG